MNKLMYHFASHVVFYKLLQYPKCNQYTKVNRPIIGNCNFTTNRKTKTWTFYVFRC